MTKKKTTTKKTTKKEVFTKHTVFDLEIKNDAQAEELTGHLANLKVTSGWLILKQIIEGNMALLERAIVLKKDPETNAPITEAQVDELRFKRNYLEELAGKPDELIAKFKKQRGIEIPTYDPYATNAKQMRGSEAGAPMASPLKD